VGGDRILAKTCTAAVFFDYFFELRQKSNEVKIKNIRFNLSRGVTT
jgi:hypothetical protein